MNDTAVNRHPQLTVRTPASEIVKFVDFRTHFKDRDEVIWDNNDNGRFDCPNCAGHGKMYVYAGKTYCHKCRKQYLMMEWLTEVEMMTNGQAIERLLEIAGEEIVAPERGLRLNMIPIDDEQEADFRRFALLSHGSLTKEGIDWWHSRGVSDEAISRYLLGEHHGWYTIPIRDIDGRFFSIKQRWGGRIEDSPNGERYQALRGSKNGYAPWILGCTDGQYAVIVSGEIKALALWSYLRAKGINWSVITTAAGEGGKWKNRWTQFARFANVCIWPDRDETGIEFAHSIQDNFRRDAPIIIVDDSEVKAVDDYILEGKNPIPHIAQALRIRHDIGR